jgi:hypothetical protein
VKKKFCFFFIEQIVISSSLLQLHDAFDSFEHDPAMHCAVFYGVGGSFCAGFDLEELSETEEEGLGNALAVFMDRGPMVRIQTGGGKLKLICNSRGRQHLYDSAYDFWYDLHAS